MFLSKKIAKLQKIKEAHCQKQKLFEAQNNVPEQGSLQSTHYSKKRIQKSRFRQIPSHSKYVFDQPIHALHGDWPIIIKNDQIVTELSLFNEYKTFQNITVMEEYGQKLVMIKPNVQKDKNFSTLHEIAELVSQSEALEQTTWPKTFKDYYHTYDKVMKRQSRKKTKSDTRKKFYTRVDANTEEKTKELFENNPVLKLKFRLKNHHSQLQEIVFGEKFIEELGHTTDTFISSVLQEGLPQIMPMENPCSTVTIKTLIEKYFAVEENGHEIPNLTSTLFMKNGLARDIQYNVNFLMNYETNTFGMDVLFVLKAKGEPYIKEAIHQENRLNVDFVQIMAEREKEAAYFLSEYYSEEMEALGNEEFTIVIKDIGLKLEEENSSEGIKFEETDNTDQVKYEEDF